MAKSGQFGIVPATAGGGGGGIITITQAPQTPDAQDISGTASLATPATWKSVTFVVRQGTLLINGQSFRRGTYTFSNGAGTLNSFQYDATGSTNTKIIIQT